MKYRSVHTKIWHDEWFSHLSRAGKLVFIYLITNPSIGMSGMYELPDRVICFDTGLSQSELDEVKKELATKVRFRDGWVFVVNATRYNTFKGEKLEQARRSEVSQIPENIVSALSTDKDDRVSIPYQYPIDTSISYPININNNNINNNINNNNNNNKKEYKSIKDLTDEDFEQIANLYSISKEVVLDTYDRMYLWHKSTGKGYKNYKAGLMNWIRRRDHQLFRS